MEIGDLVKYRDSVDFSRDIREPEEFGIILEIKQTKEKVLDYRTNDSVLVLWSDGCEWIWKRELKKQNENQ